MSRVVRRTVLVVIALICVGIYYYIMLPAINIHEQGFWGGALFLCALFFVIYLYRKIRKDIAREGRIQVSFEQIKQWKIAMALLILFIVLIIVYVIGSFLSSPVINAAKYQELLPIEKGDFAEDVKEVDFNTIPLLDKSSAELLGDRKMGSMIDMVSQFEVGDDYTQINYQNKPVRVTPLVYASPIKWLTNHSNGIPAYIMIDMTTQDTQVVKLDQGIKYSKSEYFSHNIYRHLRFNFPTYMFDDQIFFEIGDDGTPYWVCPVKKFNIGLFGGQTVGRVVICNAQTGECTDYAVEDVPTWVDKVYSAELLTQLYNYNGVLIHGFFNSVLGQKDCLQATNGYNYIAKDDDVWVYTGVTSLGADQSNVGFVLMNQRTMETKFYTVEGAIEDSAMSSAEGQVQNLGYEATFPLLLNISDEPTYFIALKDGAGLVKKYAMVNVQKYQWVAIGDTVKECEKSYMDLLSTNGISKTKDTSLYETASGKIEAISPITLDGNTHFYIVLNSSDYIFDVNMTDGAFAEIVKFAAGDQITIYYDEPDTSGLATVTSFE